MSFRDGLLAGRRVAVAGGALDVTRELTRLGAELEAMPEAGAEDVLDDWVAGRPSLTALVFDARASFAAGGPQGLAQSLEQAWIATRAVATGALIPAGAGRLLFIAPSPEAGPLASAARAGLENLARTLSVEWARHTVTAVALCPGSQTAADELAAIVAFLLSEAGGYFTGCRFDLGGQPEAVLSSL